MPKLSKEQVIKLAKLSRLQLNDKEIEKYQQELSAILDYVDQLDSVDVAGLKPAYQVSGLTNVMRSDDIIGYQATPEVMLKNAPVTDNGYIKVGRMI
jgi:aspartyl-tRNA(Asn)/glutamyl-tRNA(Gln) amidotransferase subunit C